MEFVNKLRLSACTVRFSLVKYDTLKKGNGQETNSRTILFCRNMKKRPAEPENLRLCGAQ